MSLSAPIDAGTVGISPRSRRLEAWACVIMGIAVGCLYVWSALQPGNYQSNLAKEPRGYYPLQTAGFRSGHLYAAIAPLPALLDLKDPYDPAANTPYRVHDMSLYKGHYYLYFGVTPVLILFWPVAAMTGRYVSEPLAVGLFCSAAIWTGMGLLLAIRRRHFPAAPFAALLMGWLCLAWATPLSLLVANPRVYEVPISCAIFLQALMLVAIYRALHSPGRPLAWMGVASLLFGLSIGARPDYLAGFIVLLVPAVFLAQSNSARKPGFLAARLLCAFLPAAICGFGLLYYNWARFGSLSEFGIHFQLAAERVTQLQAISPRYLIPHAAYYLFNAGHWDSYFPFFSAPAGQPVGMIRYAPWAFLIPAAFLRPGRGEPGERLGRMAIAVALACALLANLALLACFFGTTYRYPGDFANTGLLLAGVGALALGQRAAGHSKIVGWVLGAAAAVSVLFSAAVYAGSFPRKDIFLDVARAANWPGFALQKSRGGNFGGLRLEIRLPDHPPGTAEQILETGQETDRRDWLEISYLSDNRARLSFFHAGADGIPGREFDIPADRKIGVEARFGSLLPPFGHPVFAGWTREGYDIVKRNLRITVNGAVELRASVDCYEASPASTRVGRLARFDPGTQQAFSGAILGVERLPLVRPSYTAPAASNPEPVELSLFMPAAHVAGSDPLVLTGKGNESDLLYCVYDGANHIRFGLDHYGAGGPQSETVAYDTLVPHDLTIWMGSMEPSDAAAQGAMAPERLVVVLDGRTLLNIHQAFYPGSTLPVIVGLNAYGSTQAGREFTGEMVRVRRVAESALSGFAMSGRYGSIEMTAYFPRGVAGTQEPLAVTGASGAGDFVYVRYVDTSHVAIGFDHWGVGGLEGKPMAVDYGPAHRLAISFQSLHPAKSAEHASDVVRVLLDGRAALISRFACYPSTADQIEVGTNRIGGSTCGPSFTGNILSLEHLSKPDEK